MQKIFSRLLLLFTLSILASTTIAQPNLPTVIPVENPDSLQNNFMSWNWESFIEDHWVQPSDPLVIELPDEYLGSLPVAPFDLSEIRFIDSANLNANQQQLLAQNGFVVVPASLSQFEDAYRFDNNWDVHTGHGYWVTTDSVLHALHVAFINLLNFMENDELYDHVRNVALGSYEAAFMQYQTTQNTALEEPARAAAIYYAVALGLLDPNAYGEKVAPALQADANILINAANEAQGRLNVPFLPDYDEDFSQYQPRGTYTTSDRLQRYFRGMMWMGRITFLARDDEALQASLLALRAMQQSSTMADWAVVSEILTFLIGPTDNLGPAEYLPLAQNIFGDDLPLDALSDTDRIANFREQVLALPGPRINNVVRPMDTQVDELDENTRGFRLFGQRFTFDGYAMQRLIFPYVGNVGMERVLPSGLDVATVLGSDIAYDFLEEQGETNYTNYNTNLIELREEVNQIRGSDWTENIYGGWLMALQPLWNRDEKPYPALMNTEAWRLRDLYAGLGSWAELKHATVLYVAQPMGGLGGGGEYVADTTNYIEPNPLVFSRIAIVAASIVQGLDARSIGTYDFTSGEPPNGTELLRDAFFQLAVLSARLTKMSNKHLWGEPLSDDEQIFLKYHYGSELWYVRYFAEQSLAEPPEMSAIITDVASNPDAGTVLQVGTGYVNYIYVVTDSPQGLQLTRGSVYSYYEFINNIDNRLTNEVWHEMIQTDNLPTPPDWISRFYSE